jgi:hypothetical protein
LVVDMVATDDLFRLCVALEVKCPSKGFMSGGMRLILRNMKPSQAEIANERKCAPPAEMRR